MSRPSLSWSRFIRRISWCCLSGALLALTPIPAHAYTNSTGVGPGTLSWTYTVSTQQCSQSSYFTQYQFSAFTFTAGGSTQSLSGSAAYFQSSCSNPPTGPQPASLTLTGTNFVITFHPQSGGSGSATFQADATFTVYPAYKVIHIVYIPSGNKSFVGYNTTITNGTTSKISDSFQSTTSGGVSVGFTLNIGATAENPKGFGSVGSSSGVDFGFSSTTGDSSSFTESVSSSSNVQFFSTSDNLDHTKDQIFVWLNPAVTLTQTGPSTIAYSLGVPAADIGTDPNKTPVMDVVSATVAQLRDPTKMDVGQLVPSTQDGVTVPGLLCLCKNAVPANTCTQSLVGQNGCGCAASDFADIVAQDPFYQSGVAANATPLQVNQIFPNRFAYINTQLLDFGVQSTYTVDDKNTTQTTYTTKQMDTVSWSQGSTFTIPGGFTIGLKNGNSWTWTDTMETTKTNTLDHTMTAFLNSTNAGCYSNVDIFMDTVFHTFVFVPDSVSSSACP